MKREFLRDYTGRTIGRIEDDGQVQLDYDSIRRFDRSRQRGVEPDFRALEKIIVDACRKNRKL